MEKPGLYKKTILSNAVIRKTRGLTSDEQTRVNTVLGKFFELFISKHA